MFPLCIKRGQLAQNKGLILSIKRRRPLLKIGGVWPSGKAPGFGPGTVGSNPTTPAIHI